MDEPLMAMLRELRGIRDNQNEMMEFLRSIFMEETEEEAEPKPCEHREYTFAESGTSLIKVCADCGAPLIKAVVSG